MKRFKVPNNNMTSQHTGNTLDWVEVETPVNTFADVWDITLKFFETKVAMTSGLVPAAVTQKTIIGDTLDEIEIQLMATQEGDMDLTESIEQ